jgi:conjugative relaxase-like TrwC/TraI family protein
MLSISPIRRGGEAYYLKLGPEDYYAKGGEPPLRAYGKALEGLGLRSGDAVSADSLRNLFRGYSPDGGTPLCQNAGRESHHPGWDLTFSAPKAVSVAWSQAGPRLRAAIEDCHNEAVSKALDYVEAMARSRVGKGGLELRRVAGLVFAIARHGVSREQDPQLHSHAVTPNVAPGKDGRWRTVFGQPLFEAKMTAGALYRAELARLLQALGFRVEKDRAYFTLPDVPRELVERFSTRRRRIEEELGAERADAKTSERAALMTRARKKAVPREELLRSWRAEGEKLGFDPEAIRHGPVRPRRPEREAERLFAEALGRVTGQRSTFQRHELLRAMAELAPGTGLGSDDIRRACRSHLQSSPEIVRLGVVGKRLFTTRGTLDAERRLLGDVARLAKRRSPLVDEDARSRAIAQTERKLGATLSDEQRAAVAHLTAREGSIQVLTGLAGTGKSSTLEAARRAWEEQGYRVLGAALSGKAAEALHDASGIRSTTLARLLLPTRERSFLQAYFAAHKAALRNALRGGFPSTASFLKYMELARRAGPPSVDSKVETLRDAYQAAKDKSRRSLLGFRSTRAFLRHMERVGTRDLEVDSRTVLVVDEASMVGTAQMEKLIKEVRKAGAKLVLVGDPRQLQAIQDQGGAFSAIAKRVGAAELFDIQRQHEPWAKDAVRQAAAGKTLDALRQYAQAGLLRVANDRDEAMRALIGAWTKAGSAEAPERNLILSGSRSEAARLNAMAQQARLERGALPHEGIRHAGETLREGDRVLFTRNSRLLNVKNGQLGTIEMADPKRGRLSVRLDVGRVVPVKLSQYTHVQLGYAATTHKSQGCTVEGDAFVLLGSMQDRELSYVQLSRARGWTWLFTDRLTVGDHITELADRMSRSHEKQLASEQSPEVAAPKLGNYIGR